MLPEVSRHAPNHAETRRDTYGHQAFLFWIVYWVFFLFWIVYWEEFSFWIVYCCCVVVCVGDGGGRGEVWGEGECGCVRALS